jgi:excisionase family DNA binding protein
VSDFIPVEQAAQRSGLHINTLKRLLREGRLRGFKANVRGYRRWLVSVASLDEYTNPVDGFLLDMPGPKLYLRRVNEPDDLDY